MSNTLTINLLTTPLFRRVNSSKSWGRAFIIACLAVFAGCSGPSPTKPVTKPVITQATGSQLYQRALGLASPQREQVFIEAAAQFNTEGLYNRTISALNLIEESQLPNYEYANYISAGAAAALGLNQLPLAQRYLLLPRSLAVTNSADSQTQASILRHRGELHRRQGNTPAMVTDLARATQVARQPLKQQISDQLWRSLNSAPLHELQALDRRGNGAQAEQAWVSLAVTARSNTEDLDQQLSSLDAWLARWGGTAIAASMPSDLALLRQVADERPQHITLWVPLSGKLESAGTSIRDGFMAAYYQGLQNASRTPQVQVLDSNSPMHTYDQIAERTDLVIGPLDKAKVNELSRRGQVEKPTLAINLPSDNSPVTADNLYFFALDIENEAIEAARRAYLDGHRKALVLSPKTSWGQRATRAFIDEWIMLGGVITDSKNYSAPSRFSKEVEQLMGVGQSHRRANIIKAAVGSTVDYRPQRRQDADMIFLLATPSNARLLNPMFAYHYGGDLSVYATSQVYSGTPNAGKDTDLNGIVFATMPWMFEQTSIHKNTAQSAQSQYTSAKLYALGIDLYRLAPRLTQLATLSGSELQGSTGTLSIVNNRLSRKPAWAQFKSGRPRLLEQQW